ncbi:methylase involved in ubiquinone/menaquinone biosynthesis [Thioflavicoccus mobilis 8321]|uniref:Methylase involved in ubiquinone/menaquinone biosynthesis n=1 Tax=Thioflavicoccus mobilis 8321 TaxID=765912 RepID=L0H364_9GAMM|nr:methyltransferase domain-containing protein [Thioflavicoccus mobilis]AGA92019.1 methylase involved in ubiquinone/menaquinone biosynthesis [Thioflavicoccus mobilis 8321]
MSDPWENYFANFSPTDGTVDFYSRIRSFVRPEHEVLDLGAGRAAWFENDQNAYRREIRLLKGRCAKVVAADVDSAVLENRATDEQVVLDRSAGLPFGDESFDLVVADYVLEHIEDPAVFSAEVFRVLKAGGVFAARTPHKYCYVAIIARTIRNAKHATVLSWVQPGRKEMDVFPTRYRLNRLQDVSRNFSAFENKSFIFRSDPAYFFGNMWMFKAQDLFHRLMPAFFSGNLFIFLVKK